MTLGGVREKRKRKSDKKTERKSGKNGVEPVNANPNRITSARLDEGPELDPDHDIVTGIVIATAKGKGRGTESTTEADAVTVVKNADASDLHGRNLTVVKLRTSKSSSPKRITRDWSKRRLRIFYARVRKIVLSRSRWRLIKHWHHLRDGRNPPRQYSLFAGIRQNPRTIRKRPNRQNQSPRTQETQKLLRKRKV